PEKIDFGGDVPPDVPDGKYYATVFLSPHTKLTKSGDWMAFCEFHIKESDDPENDAAKGRIVSKPFIPCGPDDKKRYRMFFQEVVSLCAALGIGKPVLDSDNIKTAEGWEDFFEAVNTSDKQVTVWVKNV